MYFASKLNKLRWAMVAASLASGSALAATINCDVTPRTSVIADGQTLQLAATCTGGSLSSLSLLMNGNAVSSNIDLTNHADGEPVFFTTPVGLAANGAVFSVVGTPAGADTWGNSSDARVWVKAVGTTAAAASGFASTTAPVDASCNPDLPSTLSSLANVQLCANGSKPALVVTGPTSYSWSCLSLTGGAEANCYATRSVSWTVTATDNGSPNGNVSPASQEVANGSSAVVTATPISGYTTSWSSNCGPTTSGSNTYTTNALTANCTVTASFSNVAINGSCGTANGQTLASAPTGSTLCSAGTATSVITGASSYTWSCTSPNGGTTASCSATIAVSPPPPTGNDPGVGSGLWIPAGTSNRIVADPSGPDLNRIVSYIPGCLNGLTANNSATGCAALSSYTGTLAGTTTTQTVTINSGKSVLIRYRPKANAGSSVKGIYLSDATGGAVGASVKIWISTDPTSTYDTVPAACRNTSTSYPAVTTGPGYCQISTANPVYYLGIESSSATPLRYKVQESQSDFY